MIVFITLCTPSLLTLVKEMRYDLSINTWQSLSLCIIIA